MAVCMWAGKCLITHVQIVQEDGHLLRCLQCTNVCSCCKLDTLWAHLHHTQGSSSCSVSVKGRESGREKGKGGKFAGQGGKQP